MKISIVIPAYNAQRYLAETVESVLRQTVRDWELVIVDDGSSDDTASLARGYAARDSRIRLISQPNGGVATARNRGLAESDPRSEYVTFLDADDLWDPDALETLARALDADPRAVAAHGLARAVDAEGKALLSDEAQAAEFRRRTMAGRKTRWSDRSEPTTFDMLIYDNCLWTPGVALIRRAALRGMALFDQSVAPSEDWDLWLRLSLRGYFAYVDRIVLSYRRHEESASRRAQVMFETSVRVRRKMLALPELSAAQRRLAHRRYRRMFASVERHNARDCAASAARRLAQGQIVEAAREGGQALRRGLRYLSLRLFWFDRRDRGPIPLRLAEQARPGRAAGGLP